MFARPRQAIPGRYKLSQKKEQKADKDKSGRGAAIKRCCTNPQHHLLHGRRNILIISSHSIERGTKGRIGLCPFFLPFFFVKKFLGRKADKKRHYMQPFVLRCFKPGASVPPSSFFLLSRGQHAGRPSWSPNSNCFRVTCAAGDRDRYYWIAFALWQARRFEYCLVGSVIPLLRIRDAKRLILEQAPCFDRVEKVLPQVGRLSDLEENLQQQIRLVREMRIALLRQATRPDPEPSACLSFVHQPSIIS